MTQILAITNAKGYAWTDWFIGIQRSFLSGGAVALATLGGGSIVGLTRSQLWGMVGSNFVIMGLYRMGEFLQLHGAPDKLQQTLETAATATAQAGQAIAQAKTEVDPPK